MVGILNRLLHVCRMELKILFNGNISSGLKGN